MSEFNHLLSRCTLLFFCTVLLVSAPVHAFTANSLDITIDKSGDATAIFRFTLEGLIENAIPQSMLEEQLLKGLSGSSDPPTLVSMDRSSATLVLKNFASVSPSTLGTDYLTSSMDFRKAEIALQNSAVSSVITADFSPEKATLTFPDGHVRSFSNVESLPSVTYTIIDPAKAAAAQGCVINITATPVDAEVWIDGTNMGNAPCTFTGIAPGHHTLMFQKDGFTPVTKEVNVTEGKPVRMSVFLAAAPPTTQSSASPAGCVAALAALAIAGCVMICSGRRK
jgi:hypothetical protein